MEFLILIAFGLLAGCTAQFVLPGRSPGGVAGTMAIGVLASFFGGAAATVLKWGTPGRFDIPALATAMAATIVALFAFRLYVDRAKY